MPILNRCSAHLKKIAQNARPATVRSYTSRNVETTAYTRDTVLKSTDGGRRGRRLRYRTCSTHARRCRTTCRPCGATSRRAGSGCGGHWGRGSCLGRGRDPKQRRARASTCTNIMTRFRKHGLLLFKTAARSYPVSMSIRTIPICCRPKKCNARPLAEGLMLPLQFLLRALVPLPHLPD